MLKLKLQYFGHLMWRNDSFEKTLIVGKIEGGRRRGWQRMWWLDGITDLNCIISRTFPSSHTGAPCSLRQHICHTRAPGSVQFSCSVVSDSLRPHEPQHARPPCPSPTHGVHPSSCPWSQWCHPTISSSVVPVFFCLQSFPASGSFQMSQLFASGDQSMGVSASASVLPKNT